MKKTLTTFALSFTIFTFYSTLSNAQTYFSDNFENGLGQWIVGGNNWDTLSTTYTSSNHCVTDSRVGNYTYNSDPTITMSQTLNLTASTSPVLTFFHRHNLYPGCSNPDNINIQISTNAGFNWTTLQTWYNTNLAWTFGGPIDLTNYRTNLVKIRFVLSSHNSCGGVADGWYIDDIKIQEVSTLNPIISFPFTDNFENGMSNWIKGGFNWDTTSSTYTSPQRSITESRNGNYNYNSDPTLTMSGVLNLSGTFSPVLTFFHRYNLYPGCSNPDNITIQISTNAGFNWTILQTWYNTNLAWSFVQIDLSNYRTDMLKIRFVLSSHNSCGGVADGWFIDDIKIQEISTLNPNFSLPFTDNFENGMEKWIKGGFNWDTTSATYTSLIHSATDSRIGNYTYNSDPTLTLSGVLDLSGTIFPVLTFFHRYNLYPGCSNPDNITIQISTNAGFTWTTLQAWYNTNNAWSYVGPIDLINYRTSMVKIRFMLSSHNSCGGVADGWYLDDVSITDLASGVSQIENSIPDKFSLIQNYPNPFNPTTNIKFEIPKKSFVRLVIYNSLGKEVAVLVNEELNVGSYQTDWNAGVYPSGVYFYRIETQDFAQTKSMVLLK